MKVHSLKLSNAIKLMHMSLAETILNYQTVLPLIEWTHHVSWN